MGFRRPYGNEYSENGWRMVDRDMCVVANALPYTNTAPIRGGDAATILNAWLIWYHRNVEPLSSPVWGWSATNDVPNSNHLSGTAVDLNAPKYPWGQRVMPADRIARIRRGLALFEGSIFWGADWSRADEMHYQIGWREGDPRVAAFAAKLNNNHLGIYGPAPTPGGGMNIEQEIRNQLTGSAELGKYPGWPQLGNRTVVDALAVIGQKLGIPGFKDVM
ncbi:D-alanyl-D-alanine carboxypeptidase-like protein [Rhodococcus sp. AG1013]|uniref:M15 family metallopeptidase n=1 Tax=Rhodococcus sp. AG1013 TaxID=2183996 RepID=UPI000E0B76C8|nr:M15 family metallopeptidase [Rhodococcus sp. AG1013]RDI13441.1 D-alanyl-D-alanine carboxypeptidase-like protein [Rhodococcus sp. AG1013]